MYRVDLNSDLGEAFGCYTLGMDEEIIKQASSVNVACGWHAGDPIIMEKTVAAAKKYGCAVGAHPGFNDLAGFGRRNMGISPAEAKAYTMYQIGALAAFTNAAKTELQHVKIHGALYNMAAVDYNLAKAIAQGILETDRNLIFLALSGSMMIKAAQDIGLKFACEVFADRGYMPDGTLVPRNREGAFIHDKNHAIARVIRMVKEGKVTACDGTDIAMTAHSVCVHGDNPQAVEFAREIKKALNDNDIELVNLRELVK